MLLERPDCSRCLSDRISDIPIRTLAEMRGQPLLACECHRRNQLAIGVAAGRIATEFGEPQEVERGAHVDLLVHHRTNAVARAFGPEVRLLPSFDECREEG